MIFWALLNNHGLYVGGSKVIHLSARNNGIVESSLYSFSDGNQIKVKTRAKKPHNAIKKAKKEIGKKGYNLWINNCEQFVNYCIKDKRTSNQVSNTNHILTQTAARNGLLGTASKRIVTGPAATIVLTSTALKYAGEYIGLPDSVNTIIGIPGDMVGKTLEAGISGVSKALGNTYDELSEGNLIDAGAELVGSLAETTGDVLSAPFNVLGDGFEAISSWFD